MNFVADESLDFPIIKALRKEGHSIYSILEDHQGAEDDTILKLAREKNCVLITTDKDFGELVYRLKNMSSGIILLRLAGLSVQEKIQILIPAIQIHEKEFANAFTVITKPSIRIRKLPDQG